jgi:polysaccharide export outer membrane protein
MCIVAAVLASCDWVPAAAPTTSQLARTDDENWDGYFVKVTSLVARTLASYRGPSFPAVFRSERYKPSIALKPGDTIGITVYETAGSTLFQGTVPPLMTGTPGLPAPQSSTLPLQIVESNGTVTIPYVGNVRVAGRTPAEAAALIQADLSEQTVRPQVVVSLVGNTSNTVAVGGEVNKAGLMPITLRGERLLDVVAWAGGPKYPAIQTDLRLMRGGNVFSLPLQQVMSSPEDNIVAEPNDSIVLVRNPKRVLVMGASQKVNEYPFEYESMTMAEAIAKAGGGVDTTTNLAGVFLFRYEPGPFARKVFTTDPQAVGLRYASARPDALDAGSRVPVIYQVDLTKADGYFLAQQIPLRDKDVVLLSNSQATQLLKVLQILRGVSGIYFDLKRGVAYD